ncbi:glycosyltransferase [Peribacillus frigoritolerans]|uniref:glycosyltransferase n=1 Tax=Peribacillus frigoritolerans TaxID=450367 RepID=UPI00345DA943
MLKPMKNICMYRRLYLPQSETFIYEQITNMTEYCPHVFYSELLAESAFLPFSNLYPYRDLETTIRHFHAHNIRLIYARFGTGGLQMLPVKQATNLPMLTSFHGYDVSRKAETLIEDYTAKLPELFMKGEMFTVVCEHMRNRLINLGCPSHKIVVLKSGIDLDKFPFHPKAPAKKDKIDILSVGRLTEKKGMNILIQAFARIAGKYPNSRLTIIGDGEERVNLESLIEKLHLHGRVNLVGKRSHPEVREHLMNCDLFCIASLTGSDGNEEGIPNVLMEALAVGRVVVSSAHAGIPELIHHGETGYLVPEKDVDALSAMLIYALEHDSEWIQLAEKGRRKVEQEHDIRKQVRKLEQVFTHLINSPQKDDET